MLYEKTIATRIFTDSTWNPFEPHRTDPLHTDASPSIEPSDMGLAGQNLSAVHSRPDHKAHDHSSALRPVDAPCEHSDSQKDLAANLVLIVIANLTEGTERF